jgi:hypothetical protein
VSDMLLGLGGHDVGELEICRQFHGDSFDPVSAANGKAAPGSGDKQGRLFFPAERIQ